MIVRLLKVALLLLLPAGLAQAGESVWRTMALPPEAEQLNRAAVAAPDPLIAARHYAQAVRLFPSNGPALYGLGRAFLEQGRAADSLTVFRRMNEYFPDDSAVLEALAVACARLPDPRRAELLEGLVWAEQAARFQPDAPEVWQALSVLRHLTGDYRAAANAARRAVELDARRPSASTVLYQQQETACQDALSVFSPLD